MPRKRRRQEAERASKPVAPEPSTWQGQCLRGYRREEAIFFAENLIAEQREPVDIDRQLQRKYKVTQPVAANVRKEALHRLLGADESNRRDRFKTVLRALRSLYVKALERGSLTVCANILHQMREMFDLIQPFIEGGGGLKDERAERSTEELLYFAEHGVYPDEAPKENAPAIVNPLDDLS